MKIYFFMGRNERNKSRISWKVWKIQRSGRCILLRWAPAQADSRRKLIATGTMQEKRKTFLSESAASEYERRVITRKVTKGYDRSPRRKTHG